MSDPTPDSLIEKSLRRGRSATAIGIACLVGLLLVLSAGEAHADNLGSLVYVILIWPVGILCFLLLLVLGIVGRVKLRRNRKASGFSTALLVVAIGVAAGYPSLTFSLDSSFHGRAPLAAMVITVLPAELMAAWCIALGRRLRARAREDG